MFYGHAILVFIVEIIVNQAHGYFHNYDDDM